jgi:hypothetical protein
MAPVRWVTEALGGKVTWDEAEQSVAVDLPAQHFQWQPPQEVQGQVMLR